WSSDVCSSDLEEEAGIQLCGQSHAVLKQQITVVRPRQMRFPPPGLQQRSQSQRPVQSKVFFKTIVTDASRAGVLTAMARVDDDDLIGLMRQSRKLGQREEILLCIQGVDEQLSVGRTWRITEPITQAVQ